MGSSTVAGGARKKGWASALSAARRARNDRASSMNCCFISHLSVLTLRRPFICIPPLTELASFEEAFSYYTTKTPSSADMLRLLDKIGTPACAA
jgi:hypothetical protein